MGGVIIHKRQSPNGWRKIRNTSLMLKLDRNSQEVYCAQNPWKMSQTLSFIESITMFPEPTLILHNDIPHLLNASQAWCSSLGYVLLRSPLKRDPLGSTWLVYQPQIPKLWIHHSIHTQDLFLLGLLPAKDCAWKREETTVSVWLRTLQVCTLCSGTPIRQSFPEGTAVWDSSCSLVLLFLSP